MTAETPPQLRLLFWESTRRCNLACSHCRREPAAPDANELTTDEAKGLFESAAALGRPLVIFSGGEPLMRDDWAELAGWARSLDLPAALATNGTLIDDALAGRIRAAGFRRAAISIDGADAETHDRLRGAGAFKRAMGGAAALRKAGQPIQINCTLTAHNFHQLDDLVGLAGGIAAEALHLFLLVPVGCGADIPAASRLDARQYEHVLGWVCDRQGKGGIELRATCAPHYHRLARQRGIATGHGRGCLAGVSVAFVAHDGEVYPCGYLPVSCGNVRDTDLGDIWRRSSVLARLRDYSNLKGKCGACEFRSVCGGCRARAYAETGDYLAAEPNCTYEPARRGGESLPPDS